MLQYVAGLALLPALGLADGNASVDLCDDAQMATFETTLNSDTTGACAASEEDPSKICECIMALNDGERKDLLDLNCRISEDETKMVSEHTEQCLAGQCMILTGVGMGDGQYELDDTKKTNGDDTYWRNDGEAFFYNCGPSYRGMLGPLWAVAPAAMYSEKMECEGWATVPSMPAETTMGMEYFEDGAWKGVMPGPSATVEVTSMMCSTPRESEVHNSDGECTRISNLPGANGDYWQDTSKVLNGIATMWSADSSRYWFSCGLSSPFWMLASAAEYDNHAAQDAFRIQQMQAGQFAIGVQCRGRFQADMKFENFKAFEEGFWRDMPKASSMQTGAACTAEVMTPFRPAARMNITFRPPNCGRNGEEKSPFVPDFVPGVPVAAFDTCFMNGRDRKFYKFECMADGRLKEKTYGADATCGDQQIIHEDHGGEEHHAFFTNGVCEGKAGMLFSLEMAWDPNECPKADCKVGEWGNWSECSATCGDGTQTRNKPILQEKLGNGVPCRKREETRVCNVGDCPPKKCNGGDIKFNQRPQGKTKRRPGLADLCACEDACAQINSWAATFKEHKKKQSKNSCLCYNKPPKDGNELNLKNNNDSYTVILKPELFQ